MDLKIDPRVLRIINALPEKTQRIVYQHLHQLENPFTARDAEKISENRWRMHIAHTFTVYFGLEKGVVYITHFMTIQKAHKRYDRE
jgi:mRNA-degrading endonuclease RelE of RelBE toxin-antitoxin system